MRKITFDDLNERINQNQNEIDRNVLRKRGKKTDQKNSIRRRTRSQEEQKVLDQICKRKWETALQNGKVKKMGERVYYYEFD